MKRNYSNNGSMLDLFLLLALGFVVLFVLAFILIKPVDPKKKDIELEEQLLVKLEWQDDMPNDLDLWLKTPTNEIISFRRKEGTSAVLERDDLGDDVSWVNVNGREERVLDNTEVLRIKQLTDGDYYITVHHYNPGTGNNGMARGPEIMEFTITVYDGVAHKNLAIFTAEVVVYAEKPVLKITVLNGQIVSYSGHDTYIAQRGGR